MRSDLYFVGLVDKYATLGDTLNKSLPYPPVLFRNCDIIKCLFGRLRYAVNAFNKYLFATFRITHWQLKEVCSLQPQTRKPW